MRAYIVLLALSVFVVAVSAEETKPEDVVKNIKKGMEVVYKFFYEDPLGKKIAQLAKDWKEAMLEARSKVRASLAEYIRGLKNEAA
uniref:8 kDa glycoprotein n=1 Tax=Echinococcus granulosus TaxID=6210 RepID=B6E4A5_ECHGR|nr:8 kDa glycoprotein [Echinococcus granulosus]